MFSSYVLYLTRRPPVLHRPERLFPYPTLCPVCNTAPPGQYDYGGPSMLPYAREELVALFDHADDEVERIGASGRKGWQPAYRDAAMMKIAYAYGLRFNELRHLQTVDFARNPHAREFGTFGVCQVRYGKARRGSPHQRRRVLTVSLDERRGRKEGV